MKIILCLLCSLFPFMLYADFSNKNVKCDYYIEDKDEFAEVLLGGEYSNKDATGRLCYKINNIDLHLFLKNGKYTGDTAIYEYYNKKDIKSAMFMSEFPDIESWLAFLVVISSKYIEDMENTVDINKILKQLKQGKIVFEEYYRNGKVHMKQEYIVKKGKISETRSIYDNNGALAMRGDTVNGVMDGNAEIYTDRGRLFGRLVFEKGKIVYGECANERRHGKKWTAAEISNWENGLNVDCGYF